MATVDSSIAAAEAITTIKTTTCSTDVVLKNVESIPKDENKEVSHSLRLLTYNIFIRPPGITNNSNDFKVGLLSFSSFRVFFIRFLMQISL